MPSSKSSPTPKPSVEWSFEAIGTQWWIGLFEPIVDMPTLQQQIADRIEAFDATYSRFRADSLVTKVVQAAGSYQFPNGAEPLFSWYRQLYDATDGLVTPLIGQTLSDAGYDANYSFQAKPLTSPPDWDDVMHVDNCRLTTTQPVLLDFGAAGKGYLIDIIADMLHEAGIKSYCVDGSGDLYCRGLATPLRIGMESPFDATEAIGVAELSDGALCASSGSRRRWGEYNHIMSPRTLKSATEISAVWTTAASTMIADGLTTALCFTQPDKLRSLPTFEYAVLQANGQLAHSAKFPATFFTTSL